jgi:adenylate cyclase
MTLHFAGKFEESIYHVKKAMRLDPYYPNYYLGHLAVSYSMAGEHENAIANLKKVIERAKEEGGQIVPSYVYSVNSYVSLGQMEKAKDCAVKILELDPNFSIDI